MSHFYASIHGSRGEATRQGTKNSGITGHIRGWNTGAKVVCNYDPETDKDEVYVYRTGGSHSSTGDLIAHWVEDADYPSFYK